MRGKRGELPGLESKWDKRSTSDGHHTWVTVLPRVRGLQPGSGCEVAVILLVLVDELKEAYHEGTEQGDREAWSLECDLHCVRAGDHGNARPRTAEFST